MFVPTQKTFSSLTKKGNLIPVYKEILGDLETPVSAYFKIAKKAKYAFLLESVEGEEKVARYSFLAKDPELILQIKDKTAKITRFSKRGSSTSSKTIDDNPLQILKDVLKPYKFVNLPGLPRFCGGLVGYLSYDIVRHFERLPNKTKNDLNLPEACLMLAKNLLIFDHLNHKILVLNCVHLKPKSSKATQLKEYKKATKEIDRTIKQLSVPLNLKPQAQKRVEQNSFSIKSNFTKKNFHDIVKKAKKKIRSGEIIQVVLSQRFETKLKTDPFNIYRCLRMLNPSPYMYFLNFQQYQIIGSSPELLVRCERGVVETRPIAGTRPRGKSEKEDQRLSKELLNDPKEKAEHIMLVDLGRNDLGRVCKKGSVHISEFMNVERYSHVMHIVSNVKGALRKDKDDFDVLRSAFPAGTVSGAPKIRAMEIIEDLEKETRGPYAGCIGYFSFTGNLDTCITIRTIITKNQKAYIQAGAGIVADSVPAKEYQETVNKANAQLFAIELAHKQNN